MRSPDIAELGFRPGAIHAAATYEQPMGAGRVCQRLGILLFGHQQAVAIWHTGAEPLSRPGRNRSNPTLNTADCPFRLGG
jgi:hypothetical protein